MCVCVLERVCINCVYLFLVFFCVIMLVLLPFDGEIKIIFDGFQHVTRRMATVVTVDLVNQFIPNLY